MSYKKNSVASILPKVAFHLSIGVVTSCQKQMIALRWVIPEKVFWVLCHCLMTGPRGARSPKGKEVVLKDPKTGWTGVGRFVAKL